MRTEAWRTYVADSLWVLATHRAGARADGTPAFEAYSTMMHNPGAKPQRDTRTAEQVKNDLLTKLDKLAGDK